MKPVRKIIEIDEERCDGCGNCVISCAEGAIEIVDGKARLVRDSDCDGLGACLGECPRGALKIIERPADEFDPEAVEAYLKEKERREAEADFPPMACGCPSTQVRVFEAAGRETEQEDTAGTARSELTHWPVQIRLVPPQSPFLRNAHLLVVSDCAPLAYPNFHRDFIRGKVVLLGCPKFDNPAEYVQKFTEIFKKGDIRSVTVVDMEVPCCSAMPAIVKKGMEAAGERIPLEEVVIGVRGDIVARKPMAA